MKGFSYSGGSWSSPQLSSSVMHFLHTHFSEVMERDWGLLLCFLHSHPKNTAWETTLIQVYTTGNWGNLRSSWSEQVPCDLAKQRDRFVCILNSRAEIKTKSHSKDLGASRKLLQVWHAKNHCHIFSLTKNSVLSFEQTQYWHYGKGITTFIYLWHTVLCPARQGYGLLWVLYYRQIQYE